MFLIRCIIYISTMNKTGHNVFTHYYLDRIVLLLLNHFDESLLAMDQLLYCTLKFIIVTSTGFTPHIMFLLDRTNIILWLIVCRYTWKTRYKLSVLYSIVFLPNRQKTVHYEQCADNIMTWHYQIAVIIIIIIQKLET